MSDDDPFAESSDSECESGAATARPRPAKRKFGGFKPSSTSLESEDARDRVRSRLQNLKAADAARQKRQVSEVRRANFMRSSTLSVRNLRPETRLRELYSRFAKYGIIHAISVDIRAKGLEAYAEIIFDQVKDAERAFQTEHNLAPNGRKLSFAWVSTPGDRELELLKARYIERKREEDLEDDLLDEDNNSVSVHGSGILDKREGPNSRHSSQDSRSGLQQSSLTGAALERAKDDVFAALLQRERRELEALVDSLDDSRQKVARVMLYCLDHAEAAKECYEIIVSKLLNGPVPELSTAPTYRALYVLSDLLFNSNASVPKAAKYRALIEGDLGLIFARMGKLHRLYAKENAFSSRIFESRVLAVLQGWERRITFSSQFLAGLKFCFYNDVLSPPPLSSDDVNIVRASLGNSLDEVKAACMRFGLPFAQNDTLESALSRLHFAQEQITALTQDFDEPSYPSSMDGESLTEAELIALARDDVNNT